MSNTNSLAFQKSVRNVGALRSVEAKKKIINSILRDVENKKAIPSERDGL